jgi:hypothetical protein
MRSLLALVLGSLLGGGNCTPAAAEPCARLDSESQKALSYLIDAGYGLGQIQSEDPEEIVWGNRVLEAKGKAVLPCLLAIYQHGVHGELWPGKGPEPTAGRWALPLIRRIDPRSAVPLYRDLYQEASEPIARAQLAANLFALGEASFQAEVLSFLEAPPTVAPDHALELSEAQAHALAAIAEQNYRPALPTLQRMNLRENVKDRHVLAVYIAQLSGDVDAVEAAVSDGRVRDKALLALKRMGKEERLRAIAADPRNPAREAAELVLAGKIRG